MTACGYWCYPSIALASWLIAYAALRRRSERLKSMGVELGPLYLVLSSRGLGDALQRVLEGRRRASALASASPALALALMAGALYFLSSNLASYFASPSRFAAVVPLVPFVTLRSAQLIEAFLLAVPAVIIPHELSHALAAASKGIRVKGGGLIVVAFLLGAFVELDEESLKGADWRRRAAVAAAGPSANAVIAGLVLALLLTQPTTYLYLPQPLAAAFYRPAPGVMVAGVVPGSPAARAGIAPGDILVSINGTPLGGVQDLGRYGLHPGELLVLGVERGGSLEEVAVRAANESGRAMIGIYAANAMRPILGLPYLGAAVDYYLLWLFVLSLSVALFNMLPLAPFDGALFVDSLLSAALEEGARRPILLALYAISAALLALNVALSLARYGLPPA